MAEVAERLQSSTAKNACLDCESINFSDGRFDADSERLPPCRGNKKEGNQGTARLWIVAVPALEADIMIGSVPHGRQNCRAESELAALTLALGATQAGGALSGAEFELCKTASEIPVSPEIVADHRDEIIGGKDPLGDAFSVLRLPDVRRELGATYTPMKIVRTMVEWAAAAQSPCRVVDPGVGSARFLASAVMLFPKAELVGIDVDPLATLIARANLAVNGLGAQARIILGDYRQFTEQADGNTLYIGNPPYVRHHHRIEMEEMAGGRGGKTWFDGQPARRASCSFLSCNRAQREGWRFRLFHHFVRVAGRKLWGAGSFADAGQAGRPQHHRNRSDGSAVSRCRYDRRHRDI